MKLCKCGCGRKLSNYEIRYGIKFKNRKHYGAWRKANMDEIRKKLPHKYKRYYLKDEDIGL